MGRNIWTPTIQLWIIWIILLTKIKEIEPWTNLVMINGRRLRVAQMKAFNKCLQMIAEDDFNAGAICLSNNGCIKESKEHRI
jgi:hypothetical protein